LAYGALAAVVLLAWFPSLRPVIPVADDFHYIRILDDGPIRGVTSHVKAMGIWRWWGSLVLAALLGAHPLVYPIAAVLTHLGAVLLFHQVCRRVIASESGALGAALLMAAMPAGYQALMWASAYHYVLATLLFWLMLLILIEHGDVAGRQRFVFISTFLLTVAAALVHEALVICALLSPLFLWWPERSSGWHAAFGKLRERYGGTGPMLGGLLYVGLYFGTLTDLTTKKPGAFNLPTVLSVYYHQLFQIEVFLAWASRMVRQAAFSNWSIATVAAAAVLAACAFVAVRNAARATEGRRIPGLESRRAIVLFVSLLLGASLVYAAHGGFSRDSRKQYPILYFSVLVLAYGWSRWIPQKWKSPSYLKWALGGVVAIEAATAWLMIGLWQAEAKRSDELIESMIARNVSGEVRIESRPDIHDSWSFMRESFGFRLTDETMLNQAFARRPPLPGQIQVTARASAPLFAYDATQRRWVFVEAAPPGR
jgi:hypothetical protein